MKQVTYEVVVMKEPEDEGYYAYVPSLPGCNSGGLTVEEALAHIQEAIEGYLKVLIEDGDPIPQDTEPARITHVTVGIAA